MKAIIVFIACMFLFSFSVNAAERNHIRIAGSATLYPFITIAAEKFGKENGYTPIVESTGTGGGFNLLCSGDNSLKYPDIIMASRPIKPSEIKLCAKNSMNNVRPIQLGYDGIVIAQSKDSIPLKLSLEQLFLAMSKQVPHDNKMIDNFYKTWNQIDSNFPNYNIEIYGPSSTSGTRDVILKEVVEKFGGKEIREDGHYIQMPEDNNLVIQKLIRNDKAIGVIGFSFLEENPKVQPISINGAIPTHRNIMDSQYPLSRELLIYVNYDHINFVPGLSEFIAELSSEGSIGKNGYLTQMGLITRASN